MESGRFGAPETRSGRTLRGLGREWGPEELGRFRVDRGTGRHGRESARSFRRKTSRYQFMRVRRLLSGRREVGRKSLIGDVSR